MSAEERTPLGTEQPAEESEALGLVVLAPEPEPKPEPLSDTPPTGPLRDLLPPALVGLLVLGVCLWGIGRRPLDHDEYATWWAATLPHADLSRLLHHTDALLAPYYVFMHGWTALAGDSATALRLPSAVAMGAAGALTALLGRRLFDARTGVVAGVLLALAPNAAQYGQEARPYAFAALFAVAATLALLRALDRPGLVRWLLYGACLAPAVLAHPVTAALLPAHLAWARTGARRGRRTAAWAASACCGLLPVLPLVALGVRGGQTDQVGWNLTGWRSMVTMPYLLFGSPAVAAVGLLCALAALVAARDRIGPLALWALLPLPVTAATTGELHLFQERYLLFTLPAWALLAACGAVRVLGPYATRRRAVAVATAALVPVLAACSALDHTRHVTRRHPGEPDFRRAATMVEDRSRPGDGLAYSGNGDEPRALAYELRHLPARTRPTDVFTGHSARRLGRYAPDDCQDPEPCANGFRRIWVVSTDRSGDGTDSMPSRTEDLLWDRYRPARVEWFANVRVVLLVRASKRA
ncbi:glycosyltransferase family 39 protein [Streptomyces sp. NPDC057654]|uniref:glycosyltransferase family 39 protein n=1 Tax=Streptomyces sp. NPDC057654 TaxID=3346196 RepID=UPI0036B74B9B